MTAPQKSAFVEKTIRDHVAEAQDVLNELPIEEINKLGGMGALLERVRTNIADGLTAEGLAKEGERIRNISVEGLKTLDDVVLAFTKKKSALLPKAVAAKQAAEQLTRTDDYIPDEMLSAKTPPQGEAGIKEFVPSEIDEIADMGTERQGVTDWKGSDRYINSLVKKLESGEKLAPIRVRLTTDKQGDFFEVTDGHHRLAAYLRAGYENAPFVWDKYSIEKMQKRLKNPLVPKKKT